MMAKKTGVEVLKKKEKKEMDSNGSLANSVDTF